MSGSDTPAVQKNTGRVLKEASLANLRKGGGRPKGVPNKVSLGLKEMAREYTTEALQALVRIVQESDSDTARVSAANAILDRGYGKPSQVLSGDEDGGAVRMVHEILLRGVRP